MELAHAGIAPEADGEQHTGNDRVNGVASLPVGHIGDDGMQRRANKHHALVVEQRADELDVDVDRDRFAFGFGHDCRLVGNRLHGISALRKILVRSYFSLGLTRVGYSAALSVISSSGALIRSMSRLRSSAARVAAACFTWP